MKIIKVAMRKGGIGKSSVSIWLADCLAHRGYQVGIIDLDQEAGATVSDLELVSTVDIPFKIFKGPPESRPEGLDYLILDCPGTNHERYPVDLTIVPFTPGVMGTLPFMKAMKADIEPGEKFMTVVNKFNQRFASDREEKMRLIDKGVKIDHCFSEIRAYRNIQNAGCFPFHTGNGITENTNRIRDVRKEINLFTDRVLEALES